MCEGRLDNDSTSAGETGSHAETSTESEFFSDLRKVSEMGKKEIIEFCRRHWHHFTPLNLRHEVIIHRRVVDVYANMDRRDSEGKRDFLLQLRDALKFPDCLARRFAETRLEYLKQ